jgi:CHAT domain-containing protein
MDRVISAYTSTIRALRYSRANVRSSEAARVLIAAMPTTPNHPPLPLAKDEAYRIRQIVRQQPEFKTDPVKIRPTRQELCEALSGKTIAHLVCHAESEELDPSSSALFLKDGSITVAQISQMKLHGGALAYLSACRTALSSATELEDEAIALTSAFQVAGFARVVGTLWNAEDHVAFEVATAFYEGMGGDIGRAAEALHSAVSEQRRKHHNEPSMWASYIYTGA